jgi:hypothetical protein
LLSLAIEEHFHHVLINKNFNPKLGLASSLAYSIIF